MTTTRPTVILLALLAAPLTARAQTTAAPPAAGADSRWTSWLGCWRAADDPGPAGARVCVTSDGAGARLRTIVGGQIVGSEWRLADGTPRPVSDAGCRGTETVRWSAGGGRAYRVAEASCSAGTTRTLASVSFLLPGPSWVEVQTVTHDGATNVRVTRYVPAASPRLADGTTLAIAPASTFAAVASRGWTTEEVREASQYLPADGVQAAIGEGPTAFRLNAKSLTHLADGGVAERVIDLMVALTYPERFVIDRPGSGGGGLPGWMLAGASAFDPFGAPFIGPAALFDCYGSYGWASNGYWSRCAGDFSGYGRYASYYYGYSFGNGGYGGWVPTGSVIDGAGNGAPQGTGRVVNGRGYTQVRPVDSMTAGATSADRSNGSSGHESNGSGSTNGGTNSGATSSGYSGGSVSGGGDRVAVPRPPGT